MLLRLNTNPQVDVRIHVRIVFQTITRPHNHYHTFVKEHIVICVIENAEVMFYTSTDEHIRDWFLTNIRLVMMVLVHMMSG